MRLGGAVTTENFFLLPPDVAQHTCYGPGSTLLCMGLFSRFFVEDPTCTAEGTLCRIRDTIVPVASEPEIG
jgi:hypothetical protein